MSERKYPEWMGKMRGLTADEIATIARTYHAWRGRPRCGAGCHLWR